MPASTTVQPILSFRSPGLKLLVIIFLTLVMTFPLILVFAVLSERESRRNEAERNIADGWGHQQSVSGPFLLVPYTVATTVTVSGQQSEQLVTRYAVFLPQSLTSDAELKTETRARGIFAIPVYSATITLSGQFSGLDAKLLANAREVRWSEAFVAIGISGLNAIQAQAELVTAGGTAKAPFQPGIGFAQGITGIHAPIALSGPAAAFDFSVSLSLRGTRSMRFTPAGATTEARIAGDWPHPSFQGAYLPAEREVSPQGFSARWSVPNLARSLPSVWTAEVPALDDASNWAFGVDLYSPVDFYQLVGRALKYGIMFVGSAFLAFYLIELITGARVHAVQYLMIGAAQIIFYLLLLGIAEHWGFDRAYALASATTIAVTGIYAMTAFRSTLRGFVVDGIMAALYGLLYLLLAEEDYALLIGSVALLVMLVTTMFVTRKVDWYETAPTASKSG